MATRHSVDTIAAIATASGGGVGIVRVSGPQAAGIAAQLVRPWPKVAPSHKLHLGWVHHPTTGARIDQVLATVMRAPRSYTGEDVAELHGHGGALVLQQVLDAVLACGARMAQPGEFTRRAFEAGRIDLTRAEAVAELIAARSERALAAAQALHAGALEREVRTLRGQLVLALSEIEGALDFPDEQLEAPPEPESVRRFTALRVRLEALAASYRGFLHSGAEVALVGRVNAGKSSLFNALVGEERALVDAAPGTTRDVVEAQLEVGGVSVRLVDTAGDRFGAAASAVELRGLALGERRRGRADVVVLVVDGTVGFAAGEEALWAALPAERLLAWNKRDLAPAPHGVPVDARVIETSAATGSGLDELRAALALLLGAADPEASLVAVSLRQREALLDAATALGRAAAALLQGEPPELAAVEAREALHHLGRVTGETLDTEVLDAIFARFCIGK